MQPTHSGVASLQRDADFSGADKPLNRMDRLADLAHFPAAVNAGATFNVLVTMAATWWLAGRFSMPLALPLWIALVLALNLLPVALLRLSLTPGMVYPTLRRMDFIRDQHKFSDWVYLAASANMAFWILVTWSCRSYRPQGSTLAVLLAIALVATFSPVLLRRR